MLHWQKNMGTKEKWQHLYGTCNAVWNPDFSYKAPYAARSSSENQDGRGVPGSTKSMISWFSSAIGTSLFEKRM